jgi:DNA-binding transcriptional regulator YdaS (Cro superfamily)
MTPTEACTFFNSQSDLARAVGVTSQAVNKWIAQGRIPLGRQFQIQVLTRGKLRASEAHDATTSLRVPNKPRASAKNNYQPNNKFVVSPIDSVTEA